MFRTRAIGCWPTLLLATIFLASVTTAKAQTASTAQAELIEMANTKLAKYVTLPAAQRLTMYQHIARVYVKKKGQKQQSIENSLENYLLPTEENKGDAIGYEVFLRWVDEVVKGKFVSDGVTGDTASVYGAINHVGNSFLDEPQKK